MKVTILGNNSALPAYGRYPTAQVVEINDQLFLMDCGEGTQMRLQEYEIRSGRINHIFISHAHGDHYFGLIGFVSSLSMLGRERALTIYCPVEIKKVIELQMPWSAGFDIIYKIILADEIGILYENEKIEISCFPVIHSVPTHGFLFKEKKRKRILLPEKVKEYEVPKYFYKQLTDGEDYEDRFGNVVKNELVTIEGLPSKSYCFAADTRFEPNLCSYFMNVDLLYYETTYLHVNLDKAIERFHSTAKEAGQIAHFANVTKLIIGHFSSRYKDLEPFLEEAKTEFAEVELAIEGMTFEI